MNKGDLGIQWYFLISILLIDIWEVIVTNKENLLTVLPVIILGIFTVYNSYLLAKYHIY